jgi:RNA polymerase sigma factor (sigma-70 family)
MASRREPPDHDHSQPHCADDSARLAARIRAGDPTAETELVLRYESGLTLMLRRRVKDSTVAEDLCQEVFRIALPSLREGGLREGEKLAGYLWGIARHVASRHRRVAQRNHDLAQRDVLPDPTPGPEHQVIAAERARLIHHALAGLAPRDREVLTAFYIAESSKETICKSTGLTPSQFDVIKWRALKRLLSLWRTGAGHE